MAAGHPETVAAAASVLEDGGNAFDAALAGMMAAAVAEPVLASLGGGGFLVAAPAGGKPLVYDFFVATPGRKRAPEELDFNEILADFGPATQAFHIGRGAAAVPGAVAGFFAAARDLASLPPARLMEPAIALARVGLGWREYESYLAGVVAPILRATPEVDALFGDLQPGDLFRQPALADTLEALGREGEDLFYRGEIAESLVRLCADGGQVSAEDLAAYSVARRTPLSREWMGHRVATNPPPSSGGILISFALLLLGEAGLEPRGRSGTRSLQLARVMEATNAARLESDLAGAEDGDREETAILRLFAPELIARYVEDVQGKPAAPRGTTHISVADAAGNLAALSLSNGEGCGHLIPETGIHLNNMLGEADLNPQGFHEWKPGRRLVSMMAPTIAELDDGARLALGSGGSNRLRSAILQVLVHVLGDRMALGESVGAPRLHVEGGAIDVEPGLAGLEALEDLGTVKAWPAPNMFFGGVHAVYRDADGHFLAKGDPRREGEGRVVRA